MIEILRKDLFDWFQNANLLGLYIVGSYSLNEHNCYSDIDFLAISSNLLDNNNISFLREQLILKIKHIFPRNKIGFRVRSLNELTDFHDKNQSWGYDTYSSKMVFGIDIKSILPISNKPPTFKADLFDNLIEKAWYDLLLQSFENDVTFKRYSSAKSILDILHFILFFHGYFYPTSKERIDFISNNTDIINLTPVSLDGFISAFNIKRNPTCNCSDINFDKLRHVLLIHAYLKFLPYFVKSENNFLNLKYWCYDNKIYNNPLFLIKSIYRNYFCKNSIEKCKNIFFIWRIVLFEIILIIDSYRLHGETLLLKQKVYLLLDRFFIDKNGINNIDAILLPDFLIKIEKIRIKNSISGKDSSGKFTL